MSSDSKEDLKSSKFLGKKSSIIQEMFDNIAADYDKLNNIISLGRNIYIKKQVIKNILVKPESKILDICTGTGDLAIFMAQKCSSCQITGLDFSAKMLNIASKKAEKFKNINFVTGDALDLPFPDESFDITMVGYGLRNLEDFKKGILEMQRVTKKGGYVVSLDMGKPEGIINKIFKIYFFYIVPAFGKIFHGDKIPYKYLPESTRTFPSQEELVEIFKELGFSEVKNYNFAFGALAQQVARK